MFKKTIEALKAAEAAAQAELDALFVPYDPETGSGGVHWHATGAGVLGNAVRGLQGLREELEKRQVPIDAAAAEAAEQAKQAAAAQPESEPADVNATPGVVAHAEATGVDLSQVEGTGAGGKVTKADVAKAAEVSA